MLRLHKPHLKLPIRRTGAHERDELVFSRGQIIVLFALSLTVLIGIMGIAIDVSYAWVSELRIQRAADAAALAGAVYLPNDSGTGTAASLASAKQNGYVNATGGVVVNASQNHPDLEQMDVTISAPVPTFFMRIFGINSMTATREAHAQFHLPVPMGSPLNVFGYAPQLDTYANNGNKLNFWAAVQGPCTLKQQGDPYATKDSTTAHTNCAAATSSNGEYKGPTAGDPGSYDYAIKVTSAGPLTIELYDPEFCDRGTHQTQDTGDSDFDGSSNFTTTFTLYNPSDTPYDLSDDTVANGGAAITTYPGDSSNSPGATHSCSSTWVTGSGQSTYTGKWVTFATVSASGPGTYRLNVGTNTVGSSPANGYNAFGIRATGDGAQVYAGLAGTQSAMSIFNNTSQANVDSWIYLAQIGSSMQGKTMEIDLFDPGDVGGSTTARMSFEYPQNGSGAYTPITFSYRDAGTSLGTSGTTISGQTVLETATNGTSHFNGDWVVITIKIPDNYTGSPNPWWMMKYNFSAAANDRTTWRVEIIDSPVHLVP